MKNSRGETLSKAEFDGIVKLLGISTSYARQLGLKISLTPKEAAGVIHKIKADRVDVLDEAGEGVAQCNNALLFIVGDELMGE